MEEKDNEKRGITLPLAADPKRPAIINHHSELLSLAILNHETGYNSPFSGFWAPFSTFHYNQRRKKAMENMKWISEDWKEVSVVVLSGLSMPANFDDFISKIQY